MKTKSVIFVGILAAIIGYFFFKGNTPAPPLDFPKDGYFGPGNKKPDDLAIRPFKVNVSEEVLVDLKNRIKHARIGHKQLEDVHDFSYGINLETIMDFKNYWENKYDWRKAEKQLNAFPQFVTQIEGLNIHFIHAKPPPNKYKTVIPLLIVHGWPSNVYEFHKIIPFLTDPNSHFKNDKNNNNNEKLFDIAFEVVAPSIPGYGWSEASRKSGFEQLATARIFKKLMIDRLKFKKIVTHGGDFGALVTMMFARMYPENVFGVHQTSMVFGGLKATLLQIVGCYFPSMVFEDKRHSNFEMKKLMWQLITETGYFHIQATKPDTIGVGLNDSPIGLMAYLLEKYSTWTNADYLKLNDGGLEKKFTKDELLTMVTIYWVNGNIIPSQRYYKEFSSSSELQAFAQQYLKTPTGFAGFPNDFGVVMPREIVETAMNLTHYTFMKDGGHFPSLEVPKDLAADVFEFTHKVIY